MPKLKFATESNGTTKIYPISITPGIIDTARNQRLSVTLADLITSLSENSLKLLGEITGLSVSGTFAKTSLITCDGDVYISNAQTTGIPNNTVLCNDEIVTCNGVAVTCGANTNAAWVKIVNGHVDSAHINDGAIVSSKMASGSVTTDILANNAVSTDKIQSTAVTSTKLASDSVTASKIANNAISTAKIADDAVTKNKISEIEPIILPAYSSSTVVLTYEQLVEIFGTFEDVTSSLGKYTIFRCDGDTTCFPMAGYKHYIGTLSYNYFFRGLYNKNGLETVVVTISILINTSQTDFMNGSVSYHTINVDE